LIEKVTGKTYAEVLKERIFEPLDMKDSGYDNHADILKKRATGYAKQNNAYINSRYLDMSIPYAAGSLYSTVEDLYKWDQALYKNELLPQKYMDLFFKKHITAFGDRGYAYGWMVGKEALGNTKDSIPVVAHGGGINGFNTLISRAPSDKSLVVLLNNTGGAPLNQISQAIRGILNNKTYDMPKKSLVIEMSGIAEKQGLDAGIAFYNTNKDSNDYEINEDEMNQFGYELMAAENFEDAAKIFEINMERFPKSSNVYDSYAEAMMKLGKTEKAIEYYTTSVEMNPMNQNGIDMLKNLGVDTAELAKEVEVPDNILESYVGKYELQPGFILEITKEGQQMKAQATGQGTVEIFPKSENMFYVKGVEAEIQFNKAEDGSIKSLTLFQGGQEMEGLKLE